MSLAISIRLTLGCCAATVWLASAWANGSTEQSSRPGILRQAEGLPKGFDEHFFEVPLAVRVELDGRLLGEALVVLSRDDRVQLLNFTDSRDSQEPEILRQAWAVALGNGLALGNCERSCPRDLLALHYDLLESRLSILTRGAESSGQETYHRLPEQGSRGLILRNQLNLSRDGEQTVGRYALQGQGSIGNWTALAEARFDRSGGRYEETRQNIDQLYAERIHEDRFFRLGYFTPDVQGLSRQPLLLGNTPETTLGVMFGSSDSLAVNNGSASVTPIYVTPNRQGQVEIYRNGQLIQTQPVAPGLQVLDTRGLPGGIYEVEVRLIEDGQITSQSNEFVYKPNNWSNTDSPWRYNLYAGQRQELLGSDDESSAGGLSAGVIANYLLHPRVVTGLSAQRVDDYMQYGSSLDWHVLDRLQLLGSVFRTDGLGNGYDLRGIFQYGSGSVILSHSSTAFEPRRTGRDEVMAPGRTGQSSLSLNHRLNREYTASLRVSRDTGGSAGTAMDLGLSYFGKLWDSNANWRVSLFDRPGTESSGDRRSRGINFSVSTSLGGSDRRLSASLGTRTSRDGGQDRNAALTYQHLPEQGSVRSIAGTVSFDRYGTGLTADTQFENSALNGDAFIQRSSFNQDFSAGLNLDSTLAVGGDHLGFSGQYLPYAAGLIVDVETDVPNLQLRANDSEGSSSVLRPGRNVVPVNAYKSGHVLLDFLSGYDASAVIQPPTLTYHLNRGGVEYHRLRVMRTVTVIGRLLDEQSKPLRGAMLINHASRGVSEADGFFVVEISEAVPTLEVQHRGRQLCVLRVDPQGPREDGVLLAGDQRCEARTLVRGEPGPSGEGV
ncbi:MULTISPECIES: TcfC E-set like domain-containing protein [unclassified Pseudomonas]|uniref:TcfC E-set like domain-containing protein n=1 Tax=unclassified Pseudomonas TaxID=196821 RepID=UPI0021C9E740|nr:TcfC E-set like domain-containing protein [Pseudomonas sp. 20P_3.2_Bac4]MCU1744129.1 TcfC E-set like domain-containing protein [Pseudomonas sp. 20P_3.2_Bac5]